MNWLMAGRATATRALLSTTMVLALAAAGCGGGDGAQPAETAVKPREAAVTPVGQDKYAYARGLFNELCAGCHTLADAGARGQRYDLDIPSIEGGLVWHAIQNGEPGMPAFGGVLSAREISALAVYIINVAGRTRAGDDRWSTQIRRRITGEQARWARVAALIEKELDREGRTDEHSSGTVVPPAGR